MRPGLLAGVVLLTLGCAGANAPGQPASAHDRSQFTAKAEDCGFVMPDRSRLMGESEVDHPPQMTAPGPQRYPPQVRVHGIPGRVKVSYVIGRDGLVVPRSLRVIDATNHVFVPSAEEMVYASRYSPGAHLGAPVATCVIQVVHFTIQ